MPNLGQIAQTSFSRERRIVFGIIASLWAVVVEFSCYQLGLYLSVPIFIAFILSKFLVVGALVPRSRLASMTSNDQALLKMLREREGVNTVEAADDNNHDDDHVVDKARATFAGVAAMRRIKHLSVERDVWDVSRYAFPNMARPIVRIVGDGNEGVVASAIEPVNVTYIGNVPIVEVLQFVATLPQKQMRALVARAFILSRVYHGTSNTWLRTALAVVLLCVRIFVWLTLSILPAVAIAGSAKAISATVLILMRKSVEKRAQAVDAHVKGCDLSGAVEALEVLQLHMEQAAKQKHKPR